MIGNWEKSFEYLIDSEGGFAKLDGDSGGTTNHGVTQKVWEAWVGHSVTEDEMKALTVDDVKPVYKKEFWDAVRADDLPSGIDYLCFDFAVNSGTNRAIVILQQSIDVVVDGHLGPITLNKTNKLYQEDAQKLIETYSDNKETFYQSLKTFPLFGKGWLNRIDTVEHRAKMMVA